MSHNRPVRFFYGLRHGLEEGLDAEREIYEKKPYFIVSF